MSSFIEIYDVDKKLCDSLIKYYKKNTQYKTKGHVGINSTTEINSTVKESIDVVFHNDTQNKIISNFFKVLSNCVTQYLNKYNICYNLKTEYSNVISMFPPLGGFKQLHCERTCIRTSKRQLVYMLYLNDVTDGGETEFFYQKIKTKAKKGNLIIWPSDFTHTHRGVVSPTEYKYIATGWFELLS